MKLYGFFRSSAAFRVRIALNLKGLAYETVPIHLRRNDQAKPDYRAVNPQGLVPALDDGGQHPDPVTGDHRIPRGNPSRPAAVAGGPGRSGAGARASRHRRLRHPPDRQSAGAALPDASLGHGESDIAAWYNHWIDAGFQALEALLAGDPRTGVFCHGDRPGLADAALVPQAVNAERYRLDMTPYPTIAKIVGRCMKLGPFQAAHPDNQPDAER